MSYEELTPILYNLLEIEEDAISVYREILESLTNKECRTVIAGYVKAEERHVKLIKEALELLEA